MKIGKYLGLAAIFMMPFIGYFLVSYYGKDAVHMPRHYFFDSVATVNGKPDTIWHKVQSPVFTNQFGEAFTLDSVKGKVIVMDFIFTRCPSICPGLTSNMQKLQNSYLKNPDIVQFISITVDPEYDSFPVLRKYGDKHGINYDNWQLLTGDKETVYKFSMQEIKANIADTEVDSAFIHTENFFLLDSNKVVRGWYNGLDSNVLRSLARDIPTLMLEKTKDSPSIFRRFVPVLPILFIGIAFIIFAMLYLNKKRYASTDN